MAVRRATAGRAATAEGWPEGDMLFRRNAQWRGADAAYSVPLSGGRTLWLFGDTFVGPSRGEAQLVHNSIAIQDGSDPRTSRLTAHMGGAPDSPAPFFRAEQPTWLWPMAGARIPAGIVVFFMRVRSARPDLPSVLDAWRQEGSLKFFEVFDWTAVLIRDPDGPVDDWRLESLPTPPAVNRIIPGAGAVTDGDHLYAYGWRDGHELRRGRFRTKQRYRGFWRPRLAYLVRWTVDRVPLGLHDPEWWCGDGWSVDPARAVAVVDSPATEFTVHRDPDTARFVLVGAAPWLRGVDDIGGLRRLRVLKRLPRTARLLTLIGLLTVSLSIRHAAAPAGPWSRPRRVFSPRVARDVLVYAGKAHPQLEGDGLVCTYATIALRAERTLGDETLYYPRFVQVPRR